MKDRLYVLKINTLELFQITPTRTIKLKNIALETDLNGLIIKFTHFNSEVILLYYCLFNILKGDTVNDHNHRMIYKPLEIQQLVSLTYKAALALICKSNNHDIFLETEKNYCDNRTTKSNHRHAITELK